MIGAILACIAILIICGIHEAHKARRKQIQRDRRNHEIAARLYRR